VFVPDRTPTGNSPYATADTIDYARPRALHAARKIRENIAAAYEQASRVDVERAARIVHEAAGDPSVTIETLLYAREMISAARESIDLGGYSRGLAFGRAAVDTIWDGRDSSALLVLATGEVGTPPGLHVETAEPAPDGSRRFKITAEQLADRAYTHPAYSEARPIRSHAGAMLAGMTAVLADEFPGRRLVGCAPALVARAIDEACPILSRHSHDEWTGEVVEVAPAPAVFGAMGFTPTPVPVGNLSDYPQIVADVRMAWRRYRITSAEAVEHLMEALGVTNEGANALLQAVSVESLA
jgi:hypothetical protein